MIQNNLVSEKSINLNKNMLNLAASTPVIVDDKLCIKYSRKQVRFPKRKNRRICKRWKRNQKNYKTVTVHSIIKTPYGIIVSNKTLKELERIKK